VTIHPNAESLAGFVPELVLIAGMIALFMIDLLARRSEKRHETLCLSALAVFALAGAALSMQPATGSGLFRGLIVTDGFATFFKALFLAAGGATVLLVWDSNEIPRSRTGEFFALLVALVLGMFLMASASDLLMVYLSLEMVSIISYVLTGFRTGDRRANEAALKYVIYGGVASGVMIYGISLLYGLFGTTSLIGVGAIPDLLSQGVRSPWMKVLGTSAGMVGDLALVVGIVFTLAGVAYKIAAVPFHMWCPDVYEGAPTPFTAFLSTGPKAAGIALALRLMYGAFATIDAGGELRSLTQVPWPALVGILSVVTMTLGNFVAIVQTSVKRLLAYSSIAHAGYLLMGLTVVTNEGASSMMFYAAIYLLMNVGAFAVVVAVAQAQGSDRIEEFRGLGFRSPLAALALAIFLFSLTGLPPFAGFVGKFYLFKAVVAKGGVWYVALAIAGAVNSAVSLYYYARIVRAMYIDKPAADAKPMTVAPLMNAVLVGLAVPVLVLGIWFAPVLGWVERSVTMARG